MHSVRRFEIHWWVRLLNSNFTKEKIRVLARKHTPIGQDPKIPRKNYESTPFLWCSHCNKFYENTAGQLCWRMVECRNCYMVGQVFIERLEHKQLVINWCCCLEGEERELFVQLMCQYWEKQNVE